MAIDYRDMLRRYMRHVADVEGSYFLPSPDGGWSTKFSAEEHAEFTRLYAELEAEFEKAAKPPTAPGRG